jgi:hypothetical protein
MRHKFCGITAILLPVLAALFVSPGAYAQNGSSPGAKGDEAAAGTAAENSAEDPALTPEQKRLEMEIDTSTLPELAAWCRRIGLSEGGTKPELAARLKNYFKLPAAVQGEDNRKIITIEAARTTQYFRLEVVDEDYARLTGDVRVSLKEDDATHRIKAWEILFNRTRNTLTASGGVEYVKEQADTVETFKGESITVNLDNWSTQSLNGTTVRSVQNNDTSYYFKGGVVSRNDQDVTVLSRASIGNAKNPEALWSLDASRVWLLPGSDFAVFNAVLKVGEIPVLYIPFFYYPADEVVFHPVLGYRTREGSFVQTTTYLLGRPKASSSSESSLTRILGNSADSELKREGLFLRNTGKKIKEPDKVSLKAMVDYYVNMGAYLGAELNTVKIGVLSPVNLSLGIGFTRTLLKTDGGYTPFAPAFDGSSDWNRANLLSLDVPFRYRFKLDSSISGRFGSLSWNFPYYSDPWVDRDFTNRAETMDWVNMAQQGAALEESDTTASQLGGYQWQLMGNLNPSLPFLAPYISGLSLSNTSTMAFRQISPFIPQNVPKTDPRNYEPNTLFYAPDRFTIYNINGSISGTPLTLGGAPVRTNTAAVAPSSPASPGDDPLKNIGVPRSPWEKADAPGEQPGAGDKLSPPALSQRFDLPAAGLPRFSINYRISPTSSSELQFRTSEWKEPADIKWDEVSSVLSTFGGDASTTFNLDHVGGLFANAFTLSGNGAWRQYGYINEEAELYTTKDLFGNNIPNPLLVTQAREQQYKQSFFSTSYGYTGTLRPLYWSGVWGQSNFQYNIRGLIARSKFIGTGDEPEWEIEKGEWIKEKLDIHQFSTNIIASIMDKQQTLSLTTDLPPRETALSGNATIRAWISETSARMRARYPEDTREWVLEPFYATETLRFGNAGSLSQYVELNLDPDPKEVTTLTTALSLWGLRVEYTAARIYKWELLPSGWFQATTGEQTLRPRDFILSYSGNFAKSELWNRRLKFQVNLNSRLFFDLQRFTFSSFNQTLGFTLGINGFVDLTLSTTSENAVIYQYYRNLLPDLPEYIRNAQGDRYNLFLDLLNSFRFDDDGRRRDSGFKLKNFKLSMNHHLGDWNAILDLSLLPYLDSQAAPPVYKMNTELGFLVQWVPVSEIKSDIKYNEKNDSKWKVE